jgi:geranylgeranyl pyrophosphate synthase
VGSDGTERDAKGDAPTLAPASAPPALHAFLDEVRQLIDGELERRLAPPALDPGRLGEAMHYAALGPGKRLRPAIAIAAAEACGGARAAALPVAAAIEMLHAYTLVHDDLPAMDDDDLRRGRPTCHRAFDEATAILVGDALQARAFEVLANAPASIAATARMEMLRVLADAIGTRGMAGGQAIDLEAVQQRLDEAALERMHRQKTGALIRASVLLGAISAGVTDAAVRAALVEFGAEIGLAFQIQDDILDVEGTTSALGKRAGADADRVKPTYPSVLGLDAARAAASRRRDRALSALQPLGARFAPLREFAEFLVARAS